MKHLILFSFESLRADVLEDSPSAPNLQAFASESAIFTNCHAAGVNTAIAQAALLTGQYPPKNGIRHPFPAMLSPKSKTLTQILNDNQFHSIASIEFANDFLTAGLSQHFSENIFHQKTALSAVAKARTRGKRTFLFVQSGALHPHFGKKNATLSYKSRVARFDQTVFKKWWNEIRRLKLDRDTLLVVVGAHGEGISEKRGWGHGHSLDEGATRVPLIIRTDKIKAKKISHLTSTIDVLPSCLASLGLKNKIPHSVQGYDRTALLKNHSAKRPSAAYAETWKYEPHYLKLICSGVFDSTTGESGWPGNWNSHRLFRLEQQTIRKGQFKLVVKYLTKKSGPKAELYDLKADPEERVDLLQTNALKYRKLVSALQKKLQILGKAEDFQQTTRLFAPLHAQDSCPKP